MKSSPDEIRLYDPAEIRLLLRDKRAVVASIANKRYHIIGARRHPDGIAIQRADTGRWAVADAVYCLDCQQSAAAKS